MKINRVILALNNNPVYTGFWNIVAPVWKKNFNIKPTLVFNGTQEEFYGNNFILDSFDYLILDRVNNVSESNPDWSVTWSLFWAASQFSDDICLLSGIDQIPIGNFFFEKLNSIEDDKFIVGFSDAYKNYTKETLGYFNTQTNVLYPSSHLVGKGSLFKKIFKIEDVWIEEITKVHKSKDRYHLRNKFYPSKLWGLDECYLSEMISLYPNQNELVFLDIFWDYFQKRRIDLSGRINENFDLNLIKSGYYSELTCKNYNTYKNKIDIIINNIPIINF